MSPEFQQQLEEFGEIGEQLCHSLTNYLSEMGMESQRLPRVTMNGLVFSEQRDPFSGEVSLQGEWRNSQGMLCGSLSYRQNGSIYIEHDVLEPHPTDTRWIVEAITAWGFIDKLNIEPKLMPALGE